MPSKSSISLAITIISTLFAPNEAFSPIATNFPSTSTSLSMAKARKSLRKTVKASNNSRGVNPMAGDEISTPGKKTNWVPVKGMSSIQDLPQEENQVKLVDTMAEQLTNGATNPTGAVAIVNYDKKTYCFSSSCPSCKIPLTKAKVFPPNEETGNVGPRLSCDFCKSTYNVRTGEKVENAEKPGLLGGVVSGLFSAQDDVALPTYDLGEKNGQVLINLP